MTIVLSLLWLLVIAALLVRAASQQRAFRMLMPLSPAARPQARVTVIVPARNEALNIEACLTSLQRQDYPSTQLQIIAVDDRSTDDTAEIVRRLAENDERLRFCSCDEPSPGWLGKPNACWYGTRIAREDTEWLCFVDADVRAEPKAIASAIATAEAEGLGLLSAMPGQILSSFAERLVMPAGFYLLSFIQDVQRFEAPDSGVATASGPFLLIRRSLYERIGGHAAVRSEVCEDRGLAQLVKRSGERIAIRGGAGLLSVRMYRGWESLWEGLSKIIVDMLGGPWRTLLTAVAALALTWAVILVPTIAAVSYRDAPTAVDLAGLIVALLASASVLGFHVAGAIYFRIPIWYGLCFPLAYTASALIALNSVRLRALGRINWRGRQYDLASAGFASDRGRGP